MVNRERQDQDLIYKCDNRVPDGSIDPKHPGAFFPTFVGRLKPTNTKVNFADGTCFRSLTFEYSQTGDDQNPGDVTITINASKPSSLLCKDWFLIATQELRHVETIKSKGTHTVTFTNISPDAAADIRQNGVRVYMFCDGYVDTFLSVLNTIEIFVGGLGTDPNAKIINSHVPEYMEKGNIEFLQDTMNMQFEERSIKNYTYDPSNIQAGDFFSITRLDGIDPLIMYGSGSHAGHSVMAMRFEGDDELYMVES